MEVDAQYLYIRDQFDREQWRIRRQDGSHIDVKIAFIDTNDGRYCRRFGEQKAKRVREKDLQSLKWWKEHAYPLFFPYTWVFSRSW